MNSPSDAIYAKCLQGLVPRAIPRGGHFEAHAAQTAVGSPHRKEHPLVRIYEGASMNDVIRTSKERIQFLLSQAQADLRDGLYFEIRGDDLRIIVDVLKAETSDRYQTIMRCAAIAERVCREHADPTAGHAAASAIRKLAHATPLPQIPPLTSHPCDDGLRSVQCPGCLGKGCDWCNEGQQLRAAHETDEWREVARSRGELLDQIADLIRAEKVKCVGASEKALEPRCECGIPEVWPDQFNPNCPRHKHLQAPQSSEGV